MKKYLCVLLAAMLLLCACGAEKQENNNNSLLTDEGKTLKLLAITSSFGVDTTDYLYEIAKAQGVAIITKRFTNTPKIQPVSLCLPRR